MKTIVKPAAAFLFGCGMGGFVMLAGGVRWGSAACAAGRAITFAVATFFGLMAALWQEGA